MAVSPKKWAWALALLGERFGKVLSEDLAKVYLTVIDAALDDRQLGFAVSAIVTEWPNEFGRYPSARQIIEASSGVTESGVGDELVGGQIIHELWHNPTWDVTGYTVRESRAMELGGEPAVKALQSVGGGARVLATTDRTYPFLRKDFVQAYIDACKLARTGVTLGALVSGVEEQRRLRAGRRGALEPMAAVLPRVTPQRVIPASTPDRAAEDPYGF